MAGVVAAGMEEDGEPVALWQGRAAYDESPDDYILCPLSSFRLGENHSLSKVAPINFEEGAVYKGQLDALTKYCMKPSLNKAVRKNSGSKRAKPTMSGMAPSSFKTRQRVVEEYLGFCVKWQGQEASMVLVGDRQLVAKYIGYLVAKECALGTVKKACTGLAQAWRFVSSDECPGGGQRGEAEGGAIIDWFSNLNGKARAAVLANPSRKAKPITLWQAWSGAAASTKAFKEAVEVCTVWDGLCGCVGGMGDGVLVWLCLQVCKWCVVPLAPMHAAGKQWCCHTRVDQAGAREPAQGACCWAGAAPHQEWRPQADSTLWE